MDRLRFDRLVRRPQWGPRVPNAGDLVTIDMLTPNATVVGALRAQANGLHVGYSGTGMPNIRPVQTAHRSPNISPECRYASLAGAVAVSDSAACGPANMIGG